METNMSANIKEVKWMTPALNKAMRAGKQLVDGKVPVAERALLQRINRKLAKDGERLKKCPQSSQWHNDFGDYYIIDLNANTVKSQCVVLEKLAMELGVLDAYEVLAD